MARGTSVDEGRNSDPGGQRVSSVPQIGSAQQSSNDWMGITQEYIQDGSSGPRQGMAMRYGGDRDDGILFKGTSAKVDSSTLKSLNASDNGEKYSWNSMGQYGPGSPNYLAGGYGARENMTIGGDKNKGQYVGDGVNSTPDTEVNQYFISGQTPVQMPENQYLAGTDEARSKNMPRAEKGIGPRYPRNDARNQYE